MHFGVHVCFFAFLCRYRKRTDIYYSTWSFENVAKNCQFQFLEPPPPKLPVSVFRPPPPKILLPVSELPLSVFRHPPPQILLPVSELPLSVFRPLPKIASLFLDPPKILLPVSVSRPPQNIVASFRIASFSF